MDYRGICNRLLSTAVDTAAGVCKTAGSFCSIAGSAGLVSSYALKDEAGHLLYYADVASEANFSAQLNMTQLYSHNQYGFPYDDYRNQTGQEEVPLSDILDFKDLQRSGIYLMCAGAVLTSMGHLLQTWNQGKGDRKLILEKEARDAGMPNFAEYKDVFLGSVCGSVSQMLMSAGLCATYLEFGGFFNSTHSFTYPSESDDNITYLNNTLYLDSKQFNFSKAYFYDNRVSFPISRTPGVRMSLLIESALMIAANATIRYGAGLFYAPEPEVSTVTMAMIPGGVCGYARHFFAKKAEEHRVNRLLDNNIENNDDDIELSAVV